MAPGNWEADNFLSAIKGSRHACCLVSLDAPLSCHDSTLASSWPAAAAPGSRGAVSSGAGMLRNPCGPLLGRLKAATAAVGRDQA